MNFTDFLSQYAPVISAAILVLLIILVVLMIVTMAAVLKTRHRQDDFEQDFGQSESRVATQVDGLRKDIITITSDLKDSQNSQFMSFFKLMNEHDNNRTNNEAHFRDEVNNRLKAQSDSQEGRLDRLVMSMRNDLETMRKTMADELNAIREGNNTALSTLRETVDEKLQTTLNERISSSFKSVQDQLLSVHAGLGEMRAVAQDVTNLRNVLTNVKTRGTFGEMQLGLILEQILAPSQYGVNVETRPKSNERVEYAIKLPGREPGNFVWLPIDAKFPLEDYQRLTEAQEKGNAQDAQKAQKALADRIKAEAKKIQSKYVEAPYTTEFAVMYLPVESLWAEVLKDPNLIENIQKDFKVTVAGPTVLAALLNSLLMGFKTLAIEKKSSEVWELLGQIKSEFGRFAESVESAEKKADGIRKALSAMRTRTNVMTTKLKNVEVDDFSAVASKPSPALISETETDDIEPDASESQGDNSQLSCDFADIAQIQIDSENSVRNPG